MLIENPYTICIYWSNSIIHIFSMFYFRRIICNNFVRHYVRPIFYSSEHLSTWDILLIHWYAFDLVKTVHALDLMIESYSFFYMYNISITDFFPQNSLYSLYLLFRHKLSVGNNSLYLSSLPSIFPYRPFPLLPAPPFAPLPPLPSLSPQLDIYWKMKLIRPSVRLPSPS